MMSSFQLVKINTTIIFKSEISNLEAIYYHF